MTAQLNLQEKLDNYGNSHQHPTNIKIHKFCVPMIMFSVLGMFESIPGPINWAYVLIAASIYYYSRFQNNSVYAVIFVMLMPMLIFISLLGPYKFKISLILFVIGWIGQLIGHKIEGKKPSFFVDIQNLWIGPLWVFKDLVKYV